LLVSAWCGADETQLDGLRSKKFSERQAAMHQLWASREEVEQAVEAARQRGDAETMARANWILDQWRIGLTPETPPDLRRSLLGLQSESDPEMLLELLLKGVSEPFMTGLRSGDPEILEAGRQAVQKSWLHLCVKLLRRNQGDLLIEILDRCATEPSHGLIRSKLWQLQHGETADAARVPTSAEGWNRREQQVAEIWLVASQGKMEEARQLAESHRLDDIYAGLLLKQERWSELAALALSQAEAPRNRDQPYGWWSLALMAARYADDGDAFAKAQEQLKNSQQDGYAVVAALKGLVAAGEFDIAASLLKEPKFKTLLLPVFIVYQRHEQSLRTLGVRPESLEKDLERIAQETFYPANSRQSQRIAVDRFSHLLELARLTYFVGHHTSSFDLFQRLIRSKLLPEINDSQTALRVVVSQIPWVALDWRIELMGPNLRAKPAEVLPWIFGEWIEGIGNAQAELALLWSALGKIQPGDSVITRGKTLADLLAGKLPIGWHRRGDPDRLAAAIEELRSAGPDSNHEIDRLVSRVFEELGREDLASGARELGNYDYSESIKALIKRGGYSEALGLLENLLETDGEATAANYVSFCIALRGANRRDEADELEQLLQSVPLEYQEHLQLALAYQEFNATDSAELHLQRAWEMTLPGSRQSAFIAEQALGRFYVKQDAKGAPWATRGLFSYLVIDDTRTDGRESGATGNRQLRSIAFLALKSALGLGAVGLEANDPVKTRKWLVQAHRLSPHAIDSAQDITPRLRAQGHAEVADHLVNLVADAFERHLKVFPYDPTVLNNYAWILALNDQRLDRALELSEKAVRLVPDSAAYRDTLAEVLMRMGRPAEAARIERECLLDTPDDWNLHQQIRRFELALPSH
jgi:Tfp pilus assembly protein PilF